jgi:hypothetical protein
VGANQRTSADMPEAQWAAEGAQKLDIADLEGGFAE